MKKYIYTFLSALLIVQLGIFIYGCGSSGNSSSPASGMSGSGALSIVIKDAKTGAKLPMSSIFVNSSSKVGTASIGKLNSVAGWDKVDANNMGYAEITNVSADGTAMLKVTKDGYDDYSQVVQVGNTVTGYTIDIVSTDDATTQPTIEVYNPTVAPSVSGNYACSNDASCMTCGCPTNGTGGCGGGCGCTSSSSTTTCKGACRQNNSTISNFASNKCSDTGCPPNCKNCGACACTSAGNCSGESNCQLQAIPTATGGGGGIGGGCVGSACPPGCSGCGACACTVGTGGCGGSSNCTGGVQKNFASVGGGGCNGTGCPPGCRSCGACSCSTGTGGCGGSTNCVSAGGGGGTGGGGTGGGTGGTPSGPGCFNCNSCSSGPCGSCSCLDNGVASCAKNGHHGKSYCMP